MRRNRQLPRLSHGFFFQTFIENTLDALVGIETELKTPAAGPIQSVRFVSIHKIEYAHAALECLLWMLSFLKNDPYQLGNIISDRLRPFDEPFRTPLGVEPMLGRHVGV